MPIFLIRCFLFTISSWALFDQGEAIVKPFFWAFLSLFPTDAFFAYYLSGENYFLTPKFHLHFTIFTTIYVIGWSLPSFLQKVFAFYPLKSFLALENHFDKLSKMTEVIEKWHTMIQKGSYILVGLGIFRALCSTLCSCLWYMIVKRKIHPALWEHLLTFPLLALSISYNEVFFHHNQIVQIVSERVVDVIGFKVPFQEINLIQVTFCVLLAFVQAVLL